MEMARNWQICNSNFLNWGIDALESILQSKSKKEKQISYINTCIWNLANGTDEQRCRHREQICGHGGVNWEIGIGICVLPYVERMASSVADQNRGFLCPPKPNKKSWRQSMEEIGDFNSHLVARGTQKALASRTVPPSLGSTGAYIKQGLPVRGW